MIRGQGFSAAEIINRELLIQPLTSGSQHRANESVATQLFSSKVILKSWCGSLSADARAPTAAAWSGRGGLRCEATPGDTYSRGTIWIQ